MKAEEEIALPLRGKKRKLNREDLIDYFGIQRLGLSESVLENELLRFKASLGPWHERLFNSFLSEQMRSRYQTLIEERWKRLD